MAYPRKNLFWKRLYCRYLNWRCGGVYTYRISSFGNIIMGWGPNHPQGGKS